ncbi:MAG: helix-turn-helix domain-containing protein [Bacteroidales bacterium]|nr:helix-turn-helix domain-containing protein [Bacteroidales bacterium]
MLTAFLRKTLLTSAAILVSVSIYGSDYSSFRHVTLPPEVSAVEAIAQDSRGIVWFGTNQGLFCYDGYRILPWNGVSRTYSIIPLKERLYLGTDSGLAVLSARSGAFSNVAGSPVGIRSLVREGDSLWVGSFDGLYSYGLDSEKLTKHPGLHNPIVYSILDDGDCLYVGTYDGLDRYSKKSGVFEHIHLPSNRTNVFVNTLIKDENNILIGTEGRIFILGADGEIRRTEACKGNSIKTFSKDADGHILAGTDNGFFVLEPDYEGEAGLNVVCRVNHEASRRESLRNDIVWSIFRDRNDNQWFGTEDGVSFYGSLAPASVISIKELTGCDDGNHFSNILRDSKGRLWLGGNDGLILRDGEKSVWYRVDDENHPLAHNRVRRIREDREGDLWICTDGGLHHYEDGQWRLLELVDSTNVRNSNWAYDVLEDQQGRMWVATCLGGVLIKDKKALLAGDKIADATISFSYGQRGLYASQLAEDALGRIWCLYYHDGLHCFYPESLMSGVVDDSAVISQEENPTHLVADRDGVIWVAADGKLVKIDGKQTEEYPMKDTGFILSLGEVDGNIWMGSANGLVELDLKTGKRRRMDTDGNLISAIYQELGCEPDSEVYLGMLDGIMKTKPSELRMTHPFDTVLLSSLVVEGTRVDVLDGTAVPFLEKITLDPTQTDMSLSFTDLPYGGTGRLAWRFDGSDWMSLPDGILTFNKLYYGKYLIEVCHFDEENAPTHIRALTVRIRYPWYLRWWALLIFGVQIVVVIYGVNRLIRTKKELDTATEKHDSFVDNLNKAGMTRSDLDIMESGGKPAAHISVSLKQTEVSNPEQDDKLLKEFTDIINQNLDDPDFGVSSLCEITGLSSKMIYRKIKQFTGHSPVEYIKILRLRKAAEMLKTGKYNVSEAMFACGFTSPSYFARCFEQEYGTSPKHHR